MFLGLIQTMRLALLSVSILTLLLAAAWCALTVHETGSLSWDALFAFLPSLLTFISYTLSPTRNRKSGRQGTVAQSDVELFASLQKELPFNPTIQTLRDQDFGADYRAEWLTPLNRFVDTWNDPNKEFVDTELETERKALYQAAHDLAILIAGETVPNDDNAGWRTVYPSRQRGGPRPFHVVESARVLNAAARRFIPIYERFVRLARQRLDQRAG